MTDGENTYFANSKFTDVVLRRLGLRLEEPPRHDVERPERHGRTRWTSALALACANAKAAGIKIYTVAFEVTDADDA